MFIHDVKVEELNMFSYFCNPDNNKNVKIRMFDNLKNVQLLHAKINMKRKIYNNLLSWKETSRGASAVLYMTGLL